MTQKILVIDSSVAVKWLNTRDELYLEQADRIFHDLQDGKVQIVMPELAKYEVSNAIVYKDLDLFFVKISLEKFFDIPIKFIPIDLQQAQLSIEIARNFKITFYDASFMALAQKLEATLITDNPKHQNKKISGLKVVSLKNYR